jgi:hypothetical protein
LSFSFWWLDSDTISKECGHSSNLCATSVFKEAWHQCYDFLKYGKCFAEYWRKSPKIVIITLTPARRRFAIHLNDYFFALAERRSLFFISQPSEFITLENKGSSVSCLTFHGEQKKQRKSSQSKRDSLNELFLLVIDMDTILIFSILSLASAVSPEGHNSSDEFPFQLSVSKFKNCPYRRLTDVNIQK